MIGKTYICYPGSSLPAWPKDFEWVSSENARETRQYHKDQCVFLQEGSPGGWKDNYLCWKPKLRGDKLLTWVNSKLLFVILCIFTNSNPAFGFLLR